MTRKSTKSSRRQEHGDRPALPFKTAVCRREGSMSMHTRTIVTSHFNPPSEVGAVRVTKGTPGGHPADGMTAEVNIGDGAFSSIVNPQSFADGGPEWVMRYGNPESIRYSVAGLLESYDYLLSRDITMTEATRRLRLLRNARAALSTAQIDARTQQ